MRLYVLAPVTLLEAVLIATIGSIELLVTAIAVTKLTVDTFHHYAVLLGAGEEETKRAAALGYFVGHAASWALLLSDRI